MAETAPVPDLHSTMFLLIHTLLCHSFLSLCSFTFHNVSINTVMSTKGFLLILNLHSTMFLLIRKRGKGHEGKHISFTFHNVSINTFLKLNAYEKLNYIYIPQCFY